MPACVSLRERSAVQHLKSEADKTGLAFFTAAAQQKSKFYIVKASEGITKSFESKDFTVWKIGCIQVAFTNESDCLKPSVV
jgi:hypothetical protein